MTRWTRTHRKTPQPSVCVVITSTTILNHKSVGCKVTPENIFHIIIIMERWRWRCRDPCDSLAYTSGRSWPTTCPGYVTKMTWNKPIRMYVNVLRNTKNTEHISSFFLDSIYHLQSENRNIQIPDSEHRILMFHKVKTKKNHCCFLLSRRLETDLCIKRQETEWRHRKKEFNFPNASVTDDLINHLMLLTSTHVLIYDSTSLRDE